VGIGSTSPDNNLDIVGTLDVSGTTEFNNIVYTWPGSQAANYILQTNGSGTLSWVDPSSIAAGSNIWTTANGTIYPRNSTMDLLIGGVSTSSAKFAVFNINSGTPTASLSGSVAGAAVYMTGDGTLATTMNRPLILNPNGGNVGIGTTNPQAKLDIGGSTSTITNSSGDITINSYSNYVSLAGDRLINFGQLLGNSGSASQPVYSFQNDTATGLYQNAIGSLDFTASGSAIATINNFGLGIGTTAPVTKLHINGSSTDQALVIFDELGNNDIFTASASGNTRFKIDNDGYTYSQRYVDLANSSYYLDAAAVGTSLTTAGSVGIGTTNPSTFKLEIAGNVGPTADDTYDLGSSTKRWRDLYLGPDTLHIGTDGDDADISYNTTSGYLGISTDGNSGSEFAFTDTSRLGIGVSDPTAYLEIMPNESATNLMKVSGQSYAYYKAVTLTNAGGVQSNYNAELTIDTAALISAGKMQSDCDDMRFYSASNKTGQLDFWVESGCNTTTTKVWVEIPTLAGSGDTTIYMFYGNAAVSSASLPWSGTSTIIPSKDTCPVGSTRFDTLDGFYPRGNSTYGGTGDGNHRHLLHGTTSSVSSSPSYASGSNTAINPQATHSHTWSYYSGYQLNSPAYVETIFCSYSSMPNTLTTNDMAIFDSTPTGWTRNSTYDSKFMKGAATYGTSSGGAHLHSKAGVTNTTSTGMVAVAYTPLNVAYGAGNHYHNITGNTDTANPLPPYRTQIVASPDSTGVIPTGTILMANSANLPPLGWSRYSNLDAKFAYGASTAGTTGGAATHTHTYTFTTAGDTGGWGIDGGGNQAVGTPHTHTSNGTQTSDAGSSLPKYLDMIYMQKKADSTTEAFGTETAADAATPLFLIDNLGNVGIGTSSASRKLEVWSGSTDATSMFINNTSSGGQSYSIKTTGSAYSGLGAGYFTIYDNVAGADRLVISASGAAEINGNLMIDATNTQTTNGLCHSGADSDTTFTNRSIVACSAAPGDIAEWYDTSDAEPGDIVAATDETLTYTSPMVNARTGEILNTTEDLTATVLARSTKSYQKNVLGIISTSPYQTFGKSIIDYAENPNPVAITGRVPVKISSASAEIRPGDAITSSNEAGKGMKAVQAGQIVGRALDSWAPNSGKNTILVMVNLGWYDPEIYVNDTGELSIQSTGPTTYELLNGTDKVTKIGAFADLFAAQVKAGLAQVQRLVASVSLEAPQTKTDLITPLAGNDVAVQLGNDIANDRAEFVVRNSTNEPVLAVDGNGNATISGSLTVPEITANQADIQSSRIDYLTGKVAELENIKAQTADLVNATISGTLYAGNIDGFEDKVAAAMQQPSLLEQLLGSQNQATTSASVANLFNIVESTGVNASGSGSLNQSLADLNLASDDMAIGASAAFINSYFEVNGNAYVAGKLGINEQLLIGEGMQLADNYLNQAPTTANPEPILAIQPSGKGVINLMNGVMTVADTGLVTVNGDLLVSGNLTVQKTLLTDLLQPKDYGNPFQVQVAGVSTESGEVKESRFEIVNELGAPVATISAQGKAQFAGGLGIGAEDLTATTSGEVASNKTSGKATIKANANEVVIYSTNLTSDSLVYVTPIGTTDNQVLYVKQQLIDNPVTPENEARFIVGFDYPLLHDVTFNWWLIN
jgi:hypothetical protein